MAARADVIAASAAGDGAQGGGESMALAAASAGVADGEAAMPAAANGTQSPAAPSVETIGSTAATAQVPPTAGATDLARLHDAPAAAKSAANQTAVTAPLATNASGPAPPALPAAPTNASATAPSAAGGVTNGGSSSSSSAGGGGAALSQQPAALQAAALQALQAAPSASGLADRLRNDPNNIFAALTSRMGALELNQSLINNWLTLWQSQITTKLKQFNATHDDVKGRIRTMQGELGSATSALAELKARVDDEGHGDLATRVRAVEESNERLSASVEAGLGDLRAMLNESARTEATLVAQLEEMQKHHRVEMMGWLVAWMFLSLVLSSLLAVHIVRQQHASLAEASDALTEGSMLLSERSGPRRPSGQAGRELSLRSLSGAPFAAPLLSSLGASPLMAPTLGGGTARGVASHRFDAHTQLSDSMGSSPSGSPYLQPMASHAATHEAEPQTADGYQPVATARAPHAASSQQHVRNGQRKHRQEAGSHNGQNDQLHDFTLPTAAEQPAPGRPSRTSKDRLPTNGSSDGAARAPAGESAGARGSRRDDGTRTRCTVVVGGREPPVMPTGAGQHRRSFTHGSSEGKRSKQHGAVPSSRSMPLLGSLLRGEGASRLPPRSTPAAPAALVCLHSC